MKRRQLQQLKYVLDDGPWYEDVVMDAFCVDDDGYLPMVDLYCGTIFDLVIGVVILEPSLGHNAPIHRDLDGVPFAG